MAKTQSELCPVASLEGFVRILKLSINEPIFRTIWRRTTGNEWHVGGYRLSCVSQVPEKGSAGTMWHVGGQGGEVYSGHSMPARAVPARLRMKLVAGYFKEPRKIGKPNTPEITGGWGNQGFCKKRELGIGKGAFLS